MDSSINKLWNDLAKEWTLGPINLPDILQPGLPTSDEGCCLEVPNAQQIDSFSCGVVAGWTVLKAIYPDSDKGDFSAFYEKCDPTPDGGTPTEAIASALKAFRIGISIKNAVPSFLDIKRQIDAGFPIIVCIDRPKKGYWHWVTVYGYRELNGKKEVYLRNNIGNPILEHREFKKLYRDEHLICWGTVTESICPKTRNPVCFENGNGTYRCPWCDAEFEVRGPTMRHLPLSKRKPSQTRRVLRFPRAK
jgi:hypothetical protein